jgi:hypothetical protein
MREWKTLRQTIVYGTSAQVLFQKIVQNGLNLVFKETAPRTFSALGEYFANTLNKLNASVGQLLTKNLKNREIPLIRHF